MNDTILAVGLNPALQKIVFLEKLELAAVNRAKYVKRTAAGKGTNFARAVRIHGGMRTVVLEFLGGETGAEVGRLSDSERLEIAVVPCAKNTRTCTTLLCAASGTATEIIEPSGEISPEEYAKMVSMAHVELVGRACALAVCGTFPPGVPPSFMEEIVEFAAENGKKVFLDAYQNLGSTLDHPGIVLKINRSELAALSGEGDFARGMKTVMEQHPLEILAVTDGPSRALMAVRGEPLLEFTLPKLEHVVNPIGAGDTCSGVFFSEWLSGTPPAKAFASGLAAASAGCLTDSPALFEPETAEKILSQITVAPLE